MTKVKNISKGPRFFHLDHGAPGEGLPGRVVNLDPGQEWEGDLPDLTINQLKRRNENHRKAGRQPEFSLDGSEDAAVERQSAGQDEFDTMSDQQLRDFIADRDGKAPPGNTLRDTLLRKARGEEE